MEDNIKELDDKTFDELLSDSDKLVIVEFYNTTCPNCRAIAPVYSELSQELQKEAVFTRINVEQNMKIAARYGVMGVPTFKFLCKERPVGEIVGSVNATMLRNTIKDYVRHRLECLSKSTSIVYELDGYG
ncbi:MAG: thioredoxin [Thermoplasmata archaeon]|nr:MAG: thioredoxin [Thermoplasmata archaeon]